MSLTRRRIRRLPRIALLLLLITAVGCTQDPAHPPPVTRTSVQGGVSATRLARLSRCADITRWFWAVSDAAPQDALQTHFTAYMGDADLNLIHQLGFRCVRLSIEPT